MRNKGLRRGVGRTWCGSGESLALREAGESADVAQEEEEVEA